MPPVNKDFSFPGNIAQRRTAEKTGWSDAYHDTTIHPSEIWDINESLSDFDGPQWNIKIIDGKEILTTRDASMLADLGINDKDFIEITPAQLKHIELHQRRKKRAEEIGIKDKERIGPLGDVKKN